MSHLVIMAAGTGGHIIPGPGGRRRDAARGWTVSWLGTRDGMENRLVPSHGIALDSDRLLRPARQGPGAHADRRAAPAQGVLGMPRAAAPAWRRRRARHGRLRLLSRRADGRAARQAAAAGQCRRVVAADQQGAAAGRRPHRVRLRRRCGDDAQARGGHRQPGARRDRGAGRPGRALRRAQRTAARAGRRRQPGRAACSTTCCRRHWR